METPMYIVGEPILGHNQTVPPFPAPLGQWQHCKQIRGESASQDKVIEMLRREYLAIICAMRKMNLNFRIAYSHIDQIDRLSLAACMEGLGCRLVAFSPNFFGPTVGFPRDFATIFPGCVLVSPFVRLEKNTKDGYKTISSPFGEGGMVLQAGNKALLPNRIVARDNSNTSRWVTEADIAPIKEAGMEVGLIPALAMGYYDHNGLVIEKTTFNDHLDRVGCLLKDRSGKIHLVVSHEIATVRMIDEKTKLWKLILPTETIEVLKETCGVMGIEVHRAPPERVPYSINLIQVHDGRVLMTSGDNDVMDLVCSIVGNTKVVTTEIPIRYFPVWKYAGIRCLVSEMPMVLFNKVPR